MQAEKQQSWKISVHVRAKNLDFRFKSTRILPTWKLHQFSILLRLRKYFFSVKSESSISILRKPTRTSRSRLPKVFEKFEARRGKNPDVTPEKIQKAQQKEIKPQANQFENVTNKKAIWLGSWVIGALAFLHRSISEKCILMYSAAALFCTLFLLNKSVTGKASNFLLALIISTVVGSTVLCVEKYLNFIPRILDCVLGLCESYFVGQTNWVTPNLSC